MKKLSVLILVLALLLPLTAFSSGSGLPAGAPSCSVKITEDPEFEQIELEISINSFNGLGFRYGDSCNILLANGDLLKDIPYYNGYYCRTGETQIVAYPGYTHVHIAVCNGDDPTWTFYGCREGDIVTVTLAEAGKYLGVQNALNTVYSDDRADYPDDAVFANFRALSGGRLRKDVFFRGASPVNDTCNRAGFTDRLIRETGIRYVLDLADTRETIAKYAETSRPEYFLSLYDEGLVVPLGLTAAYRSAPYQASLVSGLREMMRHDGPYYIHCTEGKDRTGFVCMLLEALSGADEAALEADYMKTYANYYGILPGSERYNAILDVKFRDLCGWLTELGNGNAEEGAKAYLNRGGMTRKEIGDLQRFLTAE